MAKVSFGTAILDSAHSLMERAVIPRNKRIRLRARTGIVSQKKNIRFSKPNTVFILVDEIRAKIKNGTPAEEIAIFYRDNKDV